MPTARRPAPALTPLVLFALALAAPGVARALPDQIMQEGLVYDGDDRPLEGQHRITARLYADSLGMRHVFCNGVEIVTDGAATGELPGKVFTAGEDTRTVEIGLART